MSICFVQVPRARCYSAVSSLSLVSFFFLRPTDQAPRGPTRGHCPGCIIELVASGKPCMPANQRVLDAFLVSTSIILPVEFCTYIFL
ncbi:hypothetical protein B0H19DRAFT_530991 [Mycena capillaripes]|nr:hypothetical protein B0H19DRAFT_530991 [Mycena capillaripes]